MANELKKIFLCFSGVSHMVWNGHNYFLSWREPWHKFEDWDWFNGRNFCRDRCMDLVSFDTPGEFQLFAGIMRQGTESRFGKVWNLDSTESIRDWDFTLVKEVRLLFYYHFGPLLKWAVFFKATWAVRKIGLSLKANRQIKLSFSNSLIHTVQVDKK